MRFIVCLIAVVALLSGCIQTPTEKQGVVDNRPQLTFSFADGNKERGYIVYLDGLEMGGADQYMEGRVALRVLSGTHILRVENAGQIVLEDKIYLGDGASKNILLH
jgi:hypothetical protein